MKSLRIMIAVAIVATSALPLFAQTGKPIPPTQGPSNSARAARPLKGAVSDVDVAERTFNLTAGGRVFAMSWDDSTKMSGDPEDGQKLEVSFKTVDGKSVATSIKVLP